MQAESAIDHVSPLAAGYDFNKGLLKLLQGKYQ